MNKLKSIKMWFVILFAAFIAITATVTVFSFDNKSVTASAATEEEGIGEADPPCMYPGDEDEIGEADPPCMYPGGDWTHVILDSYIYFDSEGFSETLYDEDGNPYMFFYGYIYGLSDEGRELVAKYNTYSIVLSDSGTCTLCNFAFAGDERLVSVEFADNSQMRIEDGSFEGCTSLTTVTNVPDVSNKAFYGCTSLTTVSFSSNCTSIGNSAFKGCTSLKNVIVPAGVTEISASAFESYTVVEDEGSLGEADPPCILPEMSPYIQTPYWLVPGVSYSHGETQDAGVTVKGTTATNILAASDEEWVKGYFDNRLNYSISYSGSRFSEDFWDGEWCDGFFEIEAWGPGLITIEFTISDSSCSWADGSSANQSKFLYLETYWTFVKAELSGSSSGVTISGNTATAAYTGLEHTIFIDDPDDYGDVAPCISVSSANGSKYRIDYEPRLVAATNVDVYYIVYSLDEMSYDTDYCLWEDGTTEDVVITFTINRAVLTVNWDNAGATGVSPGITDFDYTYTGTAQGPSVLSINSNGAALALNKIKFAYYELVAHGYDSDWVLRESKPTDVGLYSAELELTSEQAKYFTFNSAFASPTVKNRAYESVVFSIDARAISDSSITASIAAQTYNGSAKTPAPTVKYGNTTLVSGTDYTVGAYSNNINAGTASVVITGKGNYSGTRTVEFAINPHAISDSSVTASVAAQTYNGSAKTPAPTVKYGNTMLVSGTDYTVGAYSNNINAGTASVVITGKGNYSGTQKVEFAINTLSISDSSITASISAQTYNGSAKTPAPTVKYGNTTLVSGTDYTIGTYSNNINAGTASVVISGKGNFSGTQKVEFAINKAKYDMSGISFNGDSVEYDGEVHTLKISSLPAGVSVSYECNGETFSGATEVGTYIVTAKFVGDSKNYEAIEDKTATLIITEKTVVEPEPEEPTPEQPAPVEPEPEEPAPEQPAPVEPEPEEPTPEETVPEQPEPVETDETTPDKSDNNLDKPTADSTVGGHGNKNGEGLSGGAVAGIVVSSVGAVGGAAAAAVVMFLKKRKL